ncbi:MAG: amino acid permease [Verrucomicrobiaceae bacterium]|nr:amino acid permease [Verrucomicrobiaceae bacterium]
MSHKTISLPSAVSLVITSMIGVGVFTSVGFQLLGLPSGFPILMLWVVGGVASLCGALCYAELVAMMPKSGGEYHILREAYHPMAGFLAGWISITAGFAAPIAAVAMAFSKYAQNLGLNVLPQNVTAATLIIVIAAVHFGSLRFIGGFLTATTGLKVGLILAFLVGALFVGKGQSPSLAPKAGDMALMMSPDFATSLVYVMFAYLGWNGAAYVASEVKDPQRNVPLAFCLGILAVMVLYITLNAVFLWCTPWDSMKGQLEAGIIAAKSVFGENGGRLMGGLISFGIISTVAGFTWAGSRVNQRIGQDFASLGFLASINRNGAPAIALVLQTVLSLVMLFSGKFDEVINYLMCQLTVCSMLAVLAVVIMRWRAPQDERPFKVPLYPLPVIIFLGVSLWMLVFQIRARPAETAWGLLTLVVGGAIYFSVQMHQRKTGKTNG